MQDELGRLGHPIAASTVWQIMHDAGIGPAPRRTGPTWKQFLTAQARGILAVDFVHVDTVLLRRIYALIVIEHGTTASRSAVPCKPVPCVVVVASKPDPSSVTLNRRWPS